MTSNIAKRLQISLLRAFLFAALVAVPVSAFAQGQFEVPQQQQPQARVAQKQITINHDLDVNAAVTPTRLPQNGWEIPVPETAVAAPVAEPQKARQQIVASKRLTEVLRNGGPLMIPIAFCSFVLVVFVFERLISLRRRRIIPQPFSKKIIDQIANKQLTKETAINECERNKSPMAKVFLAGLEKWGQPSVEVEQAILDEGERQSNYMRRFLRLINGIATVCPLLGLLGTVLGMIHAFDAIATVDATIDPKVMIATGISQALLTTAAGMTVAIPALIAYLFFSSRVDRNVVEIDSHGMRLVRQICAEAQIKTTTRSRAKKAA